MSDSFKTLRTWMPSVSCVSNLPICAAVEIVAKDLQRSLEFYRLIGLAVPSSEGPHVEVELPGGNRLLFDSEETIAGMHPGWTPPTSPGRLVLAFGVAAPAEVDALVARVAEAGHLIALQPFDAPWAQRYATVVDPDGTLVDIFATLPS